MNRITFSREGKSRGVLVATVALLTVAVSALSATNIVAPALGSTTAAVSAQEAQAAGHAAYGPDRRPVPRVVREWAVAWNSGSPERMAALFTDNGVYEDHAFQVAFHGKDGIAQWVSITNGSIDDAHVEVTDAFRIGKRISVQSTFSGRNTAGGLAGLPPTGEPFSVPAVSIFEMKGNKVQRVDDYNLADLLRQIGLPAGAWTPPTT